MSRPMLEVRCCCRPGVLLGWHPVPERLHGTRFRVLCLEVMPPTIDDAFDAATERKLETVEFELAELVVEGQRSKLALKCRDQEHLLPRLREFVPVPEEVT